jgi:hypothetical protein
MAHAGESHGDISLIGGGDDFGIPDGPAGLHRSGGARFGGSNQTVREREKRITANHAALE